MDFVKKHPYITAVSVFVVAAGALYIYQDAKAKAEHQARIEKNRLESERRKKLREKKSKEKKEEEEEEENK
eukprot:TRINITY_DN790_c0_g1_i1.p2 TRINITY_DN790_c0_g1~~TRINITY_DN790_c0_g1_i1.p2  ORF type:complete len:71 (+),score=33.49 TRINITY_DN790_c0_g1_i1:32-244(+)